MNLALAESIAAWLASTADDVQHGEVSVRLRIRGGHVKQVLRGVEESELPQRESTTEAKA